MANAEAVAGPQWITFEQPLNERVRAFLRLEYLFNQYQHHHDQASMWDARAALHTLLDILSVMGHNDFKTDLVKDLCEQRSALEALADRPGVDTTQLQRVLGELGHAIVDLQATLTSYPGAVLRESDLLAAVLNRFAIPGGTCNFDLPGYHRWLTRPQDRVVADLDRWYGHLGVLDAAIRIYLRLLRQGANAVERVAEKGVFLYTPPPRSRYHLIRVKIPAGVDAYPEISANHYRVTIRFMRLGDVDQRNTQMQESVAFRLQCCAPANSHA
ncbi:MAG TPA: cell division protein ZapD [Nevskiaceae bacterium]|nr:cell division protein ZapD [Nevskiaceae bacterium]